MGGINDRTLYWGPNREDIYCDQCMLKDPITYKMMGENGYNGEMAEPVDVSAEDIDPSDGPISCAKCGWHE